MPKERVAVYIDGFNLYHAINDLQQFHLKWVNLRKLSEKLIHLKSQRVVSVNYFSAYANHYSATPDVGKLLRHREYVKALEAKGVQCHMGNFAKRDLHYTGKSYKARWRRREEKQTDVAIAVTLIRDAYKDVFDRALVVSVDTDLLPAFRIMAEEFPLKAVVCVAPPSRPHHRELQLACPNLDVIKASQLAKSLFGPRVIQDGKIVARRPPEYGPPA